MRDGVMEIVELTRVAHVLARVADNEVGGVFESGEAASVVDDENEGEKEEEEESGERNDEVCRVSNFVVVVVI